MRTMRRALFTLSSALFVCTASFVALPVMGALFGIVSVELAASVFSLAIAYSPIYAGCLFASFVGINVTAE